MGEHIDFVENVYENVKNPLGYIYNKLSYVSGNKQYTLENCKPSSDLDDDTLDISENSEDDEKHIDAEVLKYIL